MLQPNQAALLTLFGSYRGTDRNDGLRWEKPFYVKKKVSVRARNFNSEKLKVNDMLSNPIENAAAIVWKIDDTAQATFDVDNFEAQAGGQHRHAVQLSERPRTEQTEPMASPDKKSFLLRIDPQLWAEIERLAEAELRSANSQVEYLLRDALQAHSGNKGKAAPLVAEPRKPNR